MSGSFDFQLTELGGLSPARLDDPDTLSAVLVAAAGSIGISADSPPFVRGGVLGHAAALVSVDGHIVLHTTPRAGTCLVDIVVRKPATAARGLDVIARRLARG